MVTCQQCGTTFSAEAAESMMAMGIIAYAECPKCCHEFLPLAGQGGTENSGELVDPIYVENVENSWIDDT
jgi:hypothetical protein